MKHKRHFLLITLVSVLVLCTAQSLAAAGTGRAASISPLTSEVASYPYQQGDPGDTMESRGFLDLYLPLILKGASPPDQPDAPGDTMGPEELRAVFVTYAAWLDSVNAGYPGYRGLEAQVQALTDVEFQVIYESIPDHDAFANAVRILTSPAPPRGEDGRPFAMASTCSPQATLCEPVYPSGTGYDTFIATLEDFGWLRDQDGDGRVNDEHTDENRVAVAQIVHKSLVIAFHAADIACEADPTGISCAAKFVAAEAMAGTEIALTQADYQDGLVDSAETRAAYKNSLMLSDQLSTHDAQVLFRLDNLVELRRVHLQVIELKEKREFLVSASEAGRPVSDVEFTSVQVSTDPLDSFIDVTGNTQVRMLEPGIYVAQIDLPQQAKNAQVFSFEVRHNNDIVDHFGFTLFHRGAQNNLGAGQ